MNKVKEFLLENLSYIIVVTVIIVMLFFMSTTLEITLSLLVWILLDIAYLRVKVESATSPLIFFFRLSIRVVLVICSFLLFSYIIKPV